MCTNECYHFNKKKKKENVWAQLTSGFFDQHNKWLKVVQALSMIWWLEAYDCENKLVVELESQMIVLKSINPYLY